MAVTILYLRETTATGSVPHVKQDTFTILHDYASTSATYAAPNDMLPEAGSANVQNSAAYAETAGIHQSHGGSFISPPLAAQTLSGTFEDVLCVYESNAKCDFNPRIYLYVWHANNTRGNTLFVGYSSGEAPTSWPALPTNYGWGTITETVLLDGDRIVAELGGYDTPSAAGTYTQGLRFGGASTTGYGGWLDFSAVLVMQKTVAKSAAYKVQGAPPVYKYKTVPIIGSPDGVLTDYPKKFIIHSGTGDDSGIDVYLNGEADNWPYDVRFSNGSTDLSFWRESSDANSQIVWVKLDSIPASPDMMTLTLKYGRAGWGDASNGGDTFIFWGGQAQISAGGYIQSINSYNVTNTRIHARIQGITTPTGYFSLVGYAEYSSSGNWSFLGPIGNHCGYWWEYGFPQCNRAEMNGNAASGVGSIDTSWHVVEVYTNSGRTTVYIVNDGAAVSNYSNGTTGNTHKVFVGRHPSAIGTGTFNVDWIFLRNYTTNEPTMGTWGDQQSMSYSKAAFYKVQRAASISKSAAYEVGEPPASHQQTADAAYKVVSSQSPSKLAAYGVLSTPAAMQKPAAYRVERTIAPITMEATYEVSVVSSHQLAEPATYRVKTSALIALTSGYDIEIPAGIVAEMVAVEYQARVVTAGTDVRTADLESGERPVMFETHGRPVGLDAEGRSVGLDAEGRSVVLDAEGRSVGLRADVVTAGLDAEGRPVGLKGEGRDSGLSVIVRELETEVKE